MLLVGNPTASSGRALDRIARARHAMLERGWEVTFQATSPEGTPARVAAALDEQRYDACVYIGGDGTFRDVAQGILLSSHPVPLGFLPSGTANDQGRSFGISADDDALAENLDIIGAAHVGFLDVGEIQRLDEQGRVTDEAVFFDSAGFGLMAEILEQRNRDRDVVEQIPVVREVVRGYATYVGAFLERQARSLIEPTRFHLDAVVDGARIQQRRVIDLVVKNTAIYGGVWILDRSSEPDDGLMEMIAISGRGDFLLTAVRDLERRPRFPTPLEELGAPAAAPVCGSRFELTLKRKGRPEVKTQLDGEEWRRGRRFRISVLKKLLPIVTRAGWRPPWKE